MRLTFYFFWQFIPPFVFGTVLFTSVLLLDKLFDLIDLIVNKGVGSILVFKLFALFLPTALPLAVPMGLLLACIVTLGRISEENELTAVRAAGISLTRVLWLTPLFALILSVGMIPFNTSVAPWSNKAFRSIYEQIIQAEPLINIIPRQFFSLKNIKIYADGVDKETKQLQHVFMYQLSEEGRPSDRIFAESGTVVADEKTFRLRLKSGQMQKYDILDPKKLVHLTFDHYEIAIPLKLEKNQQSTRYRNFTSGELKDVIGDLKKKGLKTSKLEAEYGLRFAIAFAPFCLALIGIPLATVLRRGGRSFSFGVSLAVIFTYYLLLIFGLTLAEKGALPPHPALWIANTTCLVVGFFMIQRLLKK